MAVDDLTEPTLDHLALASTNAWDNLIRYCYHLGGRWMGGLDPEPDEGDVASDNVGEFYFAQVEFDRGAKLELLQPIPGMGSEFLRRFLNRNGPGPHHLTFKVPDIHAAIAEVGAAGYGVVNERFDNPNWREAFLHPKQSHGIVIQIAQPGGDEPWEAPPPLPPSLQAGLPTITVITHLVADLDAATKLFSGPLALTIADQGTDGEGDYTDLTQGPWTIRLIRPRADPLRHWLADRPGRLHRIEMEVDDPTIVPGLRSIEAGWEIAPEVNQGTRLLLRKRSR
jgi:methylmalonyl-CoA/ethylmalonyl-CoA epimerase